jgi:hypothetical protein
VNKEIKETVAETFKSNPKAKKYFVCEDGQCFDNSDLARSHQADIQKKPEDVVELTRDEALKGFDDEAKEAKAKAKAEKEAAEKKAAKEAAEKKAAEEAAKKEAAEDKANSGKKK